MKCPLCNYDDTVASEEGNLFTHVWNQHLPKAVLSISGWSVNVTTGGQGLPFDIGRKRCLCGKELSGTTGLAVHVRPVPVEQCDHLGPEDCEALVMHLNDCLMGVPEARYHG